MQSDPSGNRRWFAVVVGIAAFSLICMMAFGFTLSQKLRESESAWNRTYQSDLDAVTSLNRLRAIIGYGGFIHDFKNYVLRRDQVYLDRTKDDRERYLAESARLRSLLVTDAERHALSVIDATFQEYFDRFETVTALNPEMPAADLDDIVAVDDGPALAALKTLLTSVGQRRKAETQLAADVFSVSSSFSYLGAAVGILILVSSGFSLWFLVLALRSNRELSKLLRQNDVLFDESPDALIYVGDDGRIKQANAQAAQLFGYSQDELAAMSVDQLVPERFRANHARLREGYLSAPKSRPMGRTLELRGLKKSGVEVPVDISLSYIPDAELGGTVILIVRDVTVHQKMQDELRKATAAAESSDQAKSAFLANMSHEIRTPLTGVLGMADLLEKSDLNDQQRVYVNTLRKSGGHLSSILNDILDLSKMDAGKLVLHHDEMDVPALFASVESIFYHQAREKGIDLHFTPIDGDADTVFLGDQVRVRQVLFNLVGNAVKFTEKGAVTVSCSVLPDPEAADHIGLTITVQDTGIGMNADVLKTVFDPFEQAQSRRNRSFEGSGLGLSICKRLVDAMNGTIDVDSTPGSGSTFTVMLPFRKTARKSVAPARPESAPATTKGVSILVADDNPVNRMLLEQMLQGFGHSVTLAEDGEEAFDLFKKDSFDAVLLDIHMPKLDGLETLAKMQEYGIKDGTVLIAITADVVPENVSRFLEAGFQKFVAKPIDWDALNKAILKT
ncbi:response regulator [Rhodospirillaceae bacterium KN72]|uniref:histidine kinase n=1 Tax=Pacificispira spongiicola TaxID=2729598 RepID=A0A7Y0HGC9_9PROT|nr:ATP-binding protein [Pacificispira spongiicola]NMM46746.1 response regulator [Pacificispira spongiicola]